VKTQNLEVAKDRLRAGLLRLVFSAVILCVGFVLVGGESQSFASDKKEPAKKEGAASKKTRKRTPKKKVDNKDKKTEAAFDNHVGEKSFSSEQFAKEEEEAKVDAVLLLDSSGSMKRTDPTRLRDQAAKLLVRFLSPGDRVSIFQFDQEVKRLSEFSEVNIESVKQIDAALQGVAAEGRFTDLALPLEEALRVLVNEGRTGAKRIVILLSDGQMDPHPERGTAEVLTEKLFSTLLEEYRREHIPIYTVGLSAEADREYLSRISRSSEALSFDAKNVQEVHKSFSDLYLSLKKPQLVGIEEGGFEIDSKVEEATFYISRKDSVQEVTLFSPTKEKITYLEFPPGARWYRGELYDVVTLKRPTPGSWRVDGIENPEGFATLITDLKLQAHLSKTNLRVGDSTTVFARLTTDGKVVNQEGLKEITAFRYKIASSAGIASQGVLVDDGTQGDEHAADGIYTGTIKASEEGDFRFLVGVTSATFSRQQQIPFEVSRGAIALTLKEEDTFAKEKARFIATLTKEGEKLKSVEVQLLVKNLGTNKIVAYKLKPKEKGATEFEFEAEKLPIGKFSVTARVTGKDGKNGAVQRENSEAIEFERAAKTAGKAAEHGAEHSEENVSEHAEEVAVVDEVKEGHASVEGSPAEEEVIHEEGVEGVEEGEAPAEGGSDWLFGLIGLIGAIIWSGGLFYYMTKRLDIGKNLPQREPPYERPARLTEELKKLSEKKSDRTRAATELEYEIFKLVAEVIPEPAVADDNEATV